MKFGDKVIYEGCPGMFVGQYTDASQDCLICFDCNTGWDREDPCYFPQSSIFRNRVEVFGLRKRFWWVPLDQLARVKE